MQPPRRAADAAAAEHLALARVEGRAKVSTGSSSVGVPEKQHVVRETAAGIDGPCEEQMPEKLLRRDERVGVISSGVGALHTNRGGKEKMKAPSRLPGRMTSTRIIGAKADADAHHKPVTNHCAKEKAAMSSSQRMLERHRAKQTDLNGERLANQKLHKGTSGEMPQKLQAKPRTTSSSPHLNAKTGHPLGGNSTKENTVVHVQESYNIELKEADDAIRRLNELGLGEDISSEEYIEYFEKLPDDPVVNTYFKLDPEQMIALYLRHARYRIRYYKLSQRASRDMQNCAVGLLEKEDFSDEFLHEMEYFVKFEKDGTFDWSFHPDLCKIRDLDDYQRLVPHETGTYADWDKYRRTFHSYETELEYLSYCNELSEKLKWMEDYVLIDGTSLKWGKISTRGAFQAMKIATKFSKITPSLADTAYYECVGNMRFNALWLKDMIEMYFEIWVLVAKQKKSLRSAMKEVYDLNKVLTTACKLRYALKYNCSEMETEFRTYTENVTSGATEDEAHSLIAEAVKKLARRPKFYQDYIRKKIDIAQSIGLIPVPVVRKCTGVLSKAIAISGGDFYVRRFHKDGSSIWRLLALSPFHRKRMSLMDEKAIILPYRDTSLTSEEPMAEISSQKIQIAVLDMIAEVSSNKRSAIALESVLKKVCGLVVGIAYSSLTGLREAAVRALTGLAGIDADLVWLLLADVYYSLNQRDMPVPPSQDLVEISDILPPPMSTREYLFVQYGGEGVRCDVDPSSVNEVFKRMQDAVLT